MFTPCGPDASHDPISEFDKQKDLLAEGGATPDAIRAIESRLVLPTPDDVGGCALYAAADGSTAVDYAPEGPESPFLYVGALPMAAPLIEWDQWRVPHVVVSMADSAIELVAFVPGTEPVVMPAPADPVAAAAHVRDFALGSGLRLVVVPDQQPEAHGLAARMRGMVPPTTNVVLLDRSESTTTQEIALATVRYVADVVARDTVQALEDYRFFEAGGRTIQGSVGAFSALASGSGERLLIHDDPTDTARASFGAGPLDVAAEHNHFTSQARRADVAIWSAICQGMDIRIVPTTAATGPDDDIVVVLKEQAAVHA